MQALSTSKLKVGILLAVAISIVCIGLVSIGGHQKLFTPSDSFTSYFTSVGGLQPGAPVDFHGVRIGSVKSVTLPPDPGVPKIVVVLSIERRYTPIIRSDTIAQIKTVGLLGDKFVLLSSDKDDKAVSLKPGTTIRTIEPVNYEELTRRSEDILTNISVISSSLRQLLLSMEQGDTLLGQLLSDPEFGRDSFDNLERILGDWKNISAAIENGQSLAGKVLSDKAFGRRVGDDVEDSIKRLHRMVTAADEGRGLVGKLLSPSQENETMYEDLRQFAEALGTVAEAMEAGDGFIPSLIHSSPEGRQSARDFQETLRSLSSILDKVDQGEGSAGMFVNNPEVYHNIENIVGAMNKKNVAKWYLRRLNKKGEKLRQKEEDLKREEEKQQPDEEFPSDTSDTEAAEELSPAIIPFVPNGTPPRELPERNPFEAPDAAPE